MQRVYEIQSSWDQRNKLRHFALRPPMQPSLPYKSPVYNPNLLSLFAKPSPDGKREMSTINNSGFSGYSFSQKKKHKNDSEIDPVQSLKEHDEKMEIAKKNLEADIDKKFQMILNEKEKDTKVIKSTEAKERVIKIVTDKEKYIDNKNVTHHMPPYDNKNNSNDKPKIYKTDQSEENSSSIHSDNTKHKEELDYNSIAEVMTKMFEKLNKKIEKSLMLKVKFL